MVLICEPVLLARTPPGGLRVGLIILAASSVGGIVAFIGSAFLGGLLARLPEGWRDRGVVASALDVASAARHLPRSSKLSMMIVFASAAMHLCNVLAFFALGLAAGVDMDFTSTLSVVLPAMLISLMPIALAGWGVREGAIIVGYGLFGVTSTSALATSVAFGLSLLIISLPGAFFIRLVKSELPLIPIRTLCDGRQ
jgi:hypothetical protein